ncbi:MAG: hypothetical protein IJ826_03020 [Bacteroidaceae bacterium]|nr:hypothetical protein [Bacteroidaceae bacterium]
MSDKFSKLPIATASRSMHDLSAPHITSSDFGRLDVVYHSQLVPGDDINVNVHSFLRCAPMPQPTFGKVFLNVRAFFVPNRILFADKDYWNNWRNGLSSSSHPYFHESRLVNQAFKVGDTDPILAAPYRADWRRHLSQLGFPERVYNYGESLGSFSAYNKLYSPFALESYQRIWWTWYRDSNLIPDDQFANYIRPLTTGAQTASHLMPRYCCYQKDIFTTAFVRPQSGSPANVGSTSSGISQTPLNPQNILLSDGSPSPIGSSGNNIQFIRAANALQHYLERNNIAGGRVQARFFARFGIQPDNVRLDQPEYCGGFTAPLKIGDVTANIDLGGDITESGNAFTNVGASTAGQLAGKGFVDGGTGDIKYHAKEDGTFMIISTLVPEIFYFQGVPADLTRGVDNVKEDYFTPEYEGLGYEPIKRCQVAATRLDADATGDVDNQIFGFVPRYSNYKYKLGTVSGDNVLTETKTGMQGYHLGRGLLTNGINQAALVPEFTMITPRDRESLDRIFTYVKDSTSGLVYDHFEGIHLVTNKAVRPMTASKLPQLEEDSHSNGKKVTIDNGGMRM